MSLVSVPGYSAVLGSMSLNLTASRTTGVSPAGIMFSLDGSTAPGYDEHDFWRLGGFYWDFDNPAASRGTFATGDPTGTDFNTGSFDPTGTGTWETSSDKNIVIGVPQAAHTFIVPDGGGSVVFTVLVNVKMPDGQTGQASIDVTIQAQDDYYSAANTIAVSADLDTADDWTVYDRPVPAGASKVNTMPAIDTLDGKRIMVYNNDAASWGDYDVRMGESNVMITYFGNELTGTSIVASTISFEAPSDPTLAPDFSVPAWSAGGGLIKDSGNGLGSFVVGRFIEVTGTTNNDGRYKIQEVAAGEIKVYRYRVKLVNESAGTSFTITEHYQKPQFGFMELGVDSGGVYSASNTDVSTYGWSDNLTLDGLAVKSGLFPMSYNHFTMHNLDCDASLGPKGNDTELAAEFRNHGGFSLVNRAQWCWTDASLDSSNVPIPRGAYISECTCVGNPDQDLVISARTSISFIAPDLVQDSGNGFSEIPHSGNANKVGHLIVSGSTSNDGTYPILTYLGSHLDYSVGAVTEFVVGETVTGSPSTATGVVTALAPASGTFAGGDSAGRLYITSITGTFTATDTLSAPSTATADCDSAVISAGGMILDTAAIVNESAGASITLTEPNRYEGGGAIAGAFNMPLVTWVSVYGSTTRKGSEHTMRINGGYRIFVYANNFEGEHGNDDASIGPGGKHACALRGAGYKDMGDYGDGTKTKAIVADGDWSGGYANLPISRYYVQHNNWVYAGKNVGDATSLFQMSTDAVNLGLLEDCIASQNFFADGGIASSTQNQRMHGRWMTSRGHRYTTTPQVGTTQNVSNFMQLCTEEDAGNPLSCTPFYNEPGAVPVPDAPR